jgi:predicted dehydrogenase
MNAKPDSSNSTPLNRREFMSTTAKTTAALAIAAPFVTTRPVLGANERRGVGFVGTGSRASSHFQSVSWLKTEDHQPLEIVAVSDIYRPRMMKAANALKAKAYGHYRDLLADPGVDIVCVATPDHHHCHQAIEAVRAGKDVYCEKPVSHWRQFEQVKQLAHEVKKSGRVFQLGVQYMSDPAYQQMGRLVREGLIGQPIYAECGLFRVGDWGERGMPIDDSNAKPGEDLDWKAFLGDAPKRPFDVSRFFRWRMYEDYAGGPVTDLYPHTLTPVVSMLGLTFPSLAVATGGKFRYQEREVPDTFSLLIDYPEELTIAVLGSQGNNYEGTGGRPPTVRVPILRGWDGALTIQRNPETHRNEIVFIPAEGVKKERRTFPIEREENVTMHWKNFVQCCLNRDTNTWCPVDLAYHAQTALLMGMQAYRQGRTARFDPRKEQIVV